MKIIIAGGRDFSNYQLLREKCNWYFSRKKPTAILCGKAKGADSLGEQYAKETHIPIRYFPADWKTYGKRAGMVRNRQMLKEADGLIAFWDGNSHGTKNMIQIAREQGIPVRVVYYKRGTA